MITALLSHVLTDSSVLCESFNCSHCSCAVSCLTVSFLRFLRSICLQRQHKARGYWSLSKWILLPNTSACCSMRAWTFLPWYWQRLPSSLLPGIVQLGIGTEQLHTVRDRIPMSWVQSNSCRGEYASSLCNIFRCIKAFF